MADAMVDAWLGKMDGGRWASVSLVTLTTSADRMSSMRRPPFTDRDQTVRLCRTIARQSEFAHFPICTWYARPVRRTSASRCTCGYW